MGVKERREREKSETRDKILDAARELFVTEGFEGVSMRKVAEKIEYSPTAIYLHFHDKDELVFSLCEETFSRLVRELESLDGGKDPIARLKLGLHRYVDFGLRNPQHYIVTFMLPRADKSDPALVARFNDQQSMGMRALAILREQVDGCVAAKKLKRVNVDVAARSLWSAIHGVTSLLIAFPNFAWGDRDAVIDTLIDAAVEGLRKEK
jgi:AcrR family transcriptional regulator